MVKRVVFAYPDTSDLEVEGGLTSSVSVFQLKAWLETVKEFSGEYVFEVLPLRLPDSLRMVMRDRSFELNLTWVLRPDTVAVAFGLYVWNVTQCRMIARALRSLAPDVLLIAGGPEVSDRPGFAADCPEFDVWVQGEGEVPLQDILARLMSGSKDFSDIPSVSFRCGDGFKHAPVARRTLPPGSVPNFFASNRQLLRGATYFTQTRGCELTCTYCLWNKQVMVHKDRKTTLEQLETMLSSDAEWVFICDSDLMSLYYSNRSLYDDMALLFARYPNARSRVFVSPYSLFDSVAEQVVSDFRIRFFHVGIQSLQPEVLKGVRRNWSIPVLDQLASVPEAIRKRTIMEVIYPLPGETLETYLAGLQKLIDSGYYTIYSYPLSAFRGTDLRKQCETEPGFVFWRESPYYVIETPTFTRRNWLEAAAVSYAINMLPHSLLDMGERGYLMMRSVLGSRPGIIREMHSWALEGLTGAQIFERLVAGKLDESGLGRLGHVGPHPVISPYQKQPEPKEEFHGERVIPEQHLREWLSEASLQFGGSHVEGNTLFATVLGAEEPLVLTIAPANSDALAYAELGPYKVGYAGRLMDLTVMDRLVEAGRRLLARAG